MLTQFTLCQKQWQIQPSLKFWNQALNRVFKLRPMSSTYKLKRCHSPTEQWFCSQCLPPTLWHICFTPTNICAIHLIDVPLPHKTASPLDVFSEWLPWLSAGPFHLAWLLKRWVGFLWHEWWPVESSLGAKLSCFVSSLRNISSSAHWQTLKSSALACSTHVIIPPSCSALVLTDRSSHTTPLFNICFFCPRRWHTVCLSCCHLPGNGFYAYQWEWSLIRWALDNAGHRMVNLHLDLLLSWALTALENSQPNTFIVH